MEEVVFLFETKDMASLGNIRCIPGLLVATNKQGIWLRGINGYPDVDKTIKQLPVKKVFYMNEDKLLFVLGTLTPVDTLPLLKWQALKDFLPFTIPTAALPGQATTLAKIKLIPTENFKPGNALLTTLNLWKAYAEWAPAVRLSQLKFAAAENNDVLIMGSPLPPLPGKEYWLEGNILLPNGYQFETGMASGFFTEKFNPKNDCVLLFDCDANWQKIDNIFFVPAKRSAIRMTKEIAVL